VPVITVFGSYKADVTVKKSARVAPHALRSGAQCFFPPGAAWFYIPARYDEIVLAYSARLDTPCSPFLDLREIQRGDDRVLRRHRQEETHGLEKKAMKRRVED